MTESTEQQSTWHTKLKALGPGILMASGCRWRLTYRFFYASRSYLRMAIGFANHFD